MHFGTYGNKQTEKIICKIVGISKLEQGVDHCYDMSFEDQNFRVTLTVNKYKHIQFNIAWFDKLKNVKKDAKGIRKIHDMIVALSITF